MVSFYEIAYPDVNFDSDGDTFIKCPFPHKDASGKTYYEQTPSLSVNISKGIHHCFSCGAKGTELDFICSIMNITEEQAHQLKSILNQSKETIFDWQQAINTLNQNPQIIETIKDTYKFNDQAIEKLKIGVETAGKGIAFPVFLFGKLVDVISYNPKNKPKYIKRPNSQNGIIMPYDEWKKSEKHTLIVAGQKDLGIALTKGFNAISITGGEGEIPELFLNDFKNRTVFIVYDNDDTGKQGAKKLASKLYPYTKSIRILDISDVCVEKGEDLWDYFVKYKKDKKDLIKLIRETEEFTNKDAEEIIEYEYPTMTLSEAMERKNIGKIVRSNIQVLANDENKFIMPTSVELTKKFTSKSENANTLNIDDKKIWNYSIKNAKDLFYLIDNNQREDKIKENIKKMAYLPKEYGLVLKTLSKETIFKSTVTDYFETTSIDDRITELQAYSIKNKLESGKKYKITYKLIPHPLLGNSIYMVIFHAEEAEDSIKNFVVNEETIRNLQLFEQKPNENLDTLIHSNVQKLKGLVNADYNDSLLKTIDLSFHTPLKFKIGNLEQRAYLDTLVVTESRIGKTTTVQALQKAYGVGTRIPLNGKNASIAGLVGGSHKTKASFQIRAGLIPRSHKGLIIFEELGKASGDLLKEITDIRTSGIATITRVSGSTRLPAFVRMLTLTNTKLNGSTPRPISAYPNGIEILIDLVGTAEDIARYDLILILGEKGSANIDPYFKAPEAYPIKAYRDRIRWIWSRTEEQIIISEQVYRYAVTQSNKANQTFNSYIKIFGTEAWLKLLRLATAIAGYTVSTDASYEKIIVKEKHVDYAYNYMMELYDNSVFRLKEFVENERKYTTINQEDIEKLQNIWHSSSTLLKHLEDHSKTTMKTLKMVSGLENDTFDRLMSELTGDHFLRYNNYDIYPTEKFRKGMAKIDKKSKLKVLTICD